MTNGESLPTDTNQEALIDEARKHGASVKVLDQVGLGFPDLLLGYLGVNLLVEVKHKKAKLTPIQKSFHAGWGGQVCVCRTRADIRRLLAWVRRMKERELPIVAPQKVEPRPRVRRAPPDPHPHATPLALLWRDEEISTH